MPRFVLFDNFLTGSGGHNFQYACDVLQAAEAQGYEPVAVVQRRCPTEAGWPPGWRVIPAFHDAGEYRLGLGPDGRAGCASGVDGQRLEPTAAGPANGGFRDWLAGLWSWREPFAFRERQRRILQFAQDCRFAWDLLGPGDHDRMFFPSLSDFDLLGVARFLRDTGSTREVAWHLQFHFDIFEGPEAEYDDQPDRLRRFRQQFAHALEQIPHHEVHFYCTTEAVANQYNRLGVGEFQWLPYPVADVFQPRERSGDKPLRVTCAGALRREKGKQALRPLFAALRQELLDDRALRLVVQGDPRQVKRWLPAGAVSSPGGAPSPVECVTHPLPAGAYADFICTADIGLFLYDARRYFSRCSGVLVEMLAAGIPVIAPAGCWLGQQIDAANWEYLDELPNHDTLAMSERLQPSRLQLGAAARAGTIGASAPRLIYDDVRIPDGAADTCIRLTAADRAARLSFVEVAVEQYGTGSKSLGPAWTSVLSPRRERAERSVLVHLHPDAKTLQIALRDAYGRQPLAVRATEVTYFAGPQRPAGAVGLTAAHLGQVPQLLRDMQRQIDHYRQRAGDYSLLWRHQHAAVRVVEQLEQRALGESPATPFLATGEGPHLRPR